MIKIQKKIKILHCIHSLNGGGAERQLLNYLKNSQNTNIENAILTWHKDPEYKGCFIKNIVTFNIIDYRINPILWIISSIKIILFWKPEVIQTWLPQADILYGALGKFLRKKVICTERSSEYLYEVDTNYKKRWFSVFRPYALSFFPRIVITNSVEGERYVRKITNNKIPVTIINNGIDLKKIENTAPVNMDDFFDIDKDSTVVITVSRLEEYKKIDQIIIAIDKLIKSNHNLKLLICGDGPEKQKLERLINFLGNESRIKMLGYRNEVIGIMKSCDLFCSASLVEGSPNSVLEAMSCGLPVVVSDILPHINIIKNKNGVIFEKNSIESLMVQLENCVNDKQKLKSLSKHAKLYSQEYSVEKMCNLYNNIYSSL